MTRLVLCPTGAITREPDRTDHAGILEHGRRLELSAFELRLFSAWSGHLDEVISDLRDSGLSFPVVHAENGIGAGLGSDDPEQIDDALARLEVNCRAAAAVGAHTLVLHLWEPPNGDADLERHIEQLPTCVETASAYDVVVSVETRPGAYGTPLANVRLALEREPRCKITLDTESLALHGQLAESLAQDWLWDRQAVNHVHLKDFDGRMRSDGVRRYLLPGEGALDLQAFLTGLVDRGYAGAFTVEASAVTPEGELDPPRLEQIAAVVRELAG